MAVEAPRFPHGSTLEAGPTSGASVMGNLAWSVLGEGVRLVSSFAAFMILVRVYDPADFGRLMATTALFATLFPVASLGGGWLVLQRVTIDGWSPGRALKPATGMMVTGAFAIGVGGLLVRPWILPQMPALLFAGVAISEMLLLGLVEVTLFAAQSNERLVAKAAAWSVYGIGRALGATLLFIAVDQPGLGHWIAMTIVIGVAIVVVAQTLTVGHIVVPSAPRLSDVRSGVPYGLSFGAERMLAAADSVLLVRFDFEADAGIYAAGRRLITVTLAPVLAALHAVSAKLWRAGGRSPAEARRLSVVFTAFGVVYGLSAIAGWLIVGDYVAGLLGDSYRQAAQILPWLSLVPLLTVLEVFAATAVTGSGYHNRRVVATLLVAALNVGLNLAWIPTMGWRGAVYASLLSSAVFVVLLWVILIRIAGPSRGGDGI